jgi:Glutathione-dependent formaldehyde-activating enzyme
MPALEGGCACGEMRYRLQSKPMFVHCCHCRECQRQTGSAFVINALIETSRVERLAGETEAVPVPTESGRPHPSLPALQGRITRGLRRGMAVGTGILRQALSDA